MKYALVNTSTDDIQLNLYSTDILIRNRINRPGPSLALNIKRGQSIDLLNYVKTVEEAHKLILNSYDAKKLIKPGLLSLYIATDAGDLIDAKLLNEIVE